MPFAPSRVTPEVLDTMVEMLPDVGSLRDLCAITGLHLGTVRRATAPFLAIMKLNGTHPQCGCGKDRFHPYGCSETGKKALRDNILPGHTEAESAVLFARRELAIEMLVAGERLIDIDGLFGMTKGGAKAYLRFLTAEQQAQRQQAQRDRGINPRPIRSRSKQRC